MTRLSISVVSGLSITVLVFALAVSPALADTIDFESFAEGTQLGAVNTATNTVVFAVDPNAIPTSGTIGEGFVATVGAPTTAFVPNDTPAAAVAGQRFLTDELSGPSLALNYFMFFANPVLDLSLDLYDYRVDGGPSIGDTATLTVFDSSLNSVGVDIFTIPSSNPVDGNVENLSVSNPTGLISAASLVFSTPDVGTGIDNVTFTTARVPEPSLLLLLASGFGAIAAGRWRRVGE